MRPHNRDENAPQAWLVVVKPLGRLECVLLKCSCIAISVMRRGFAASYFNSRLPRSTRAIRHFYPTRVPCAKNEPVIQNRECWKMDKYQEDRARKLVNQLERTGSDCGLVAVQGAVVTRCPGAPYTDTPTEFDEIDLQNAVALNLLEQRKLTEGSITGSRQWEWYQSKRKPPRAGDWIIFSNGRRRIDGIEQGIAFYGKGKNDLVPVVNLVPALNAEPDCWEVDARR